MTRNIGPNQMTRSTAGRKMRRSIGKPLSALHAVPGALPSLPAGAAEIETLKRAIGDVHQVRDAMALLIPDVHRLIYESERQRAVNLRLMHKVAEGPPRTFVVAGTPRSYTVEQLLEMEEQFTAEYDAACAFIALVENYLEVE